MFNSFESVLKPFRLLAKLSCSVLLVHEWIFLNNWKFRFLDKLNILKCLVERVIYIQGTFHGTIFERLRSFGFKFTKNQLCRKCI